jgi:hypothetical protein
MASTTSCVPGSTAKLSSTISQLQIVQGSIPRLLVWRQYCMILDGTLGLLSYFHAFFKQTSLCSLLNSLTYDDRAFNTTFVSKDKWFEVDGAEGAKNFIRSSASADEWNEHRIQLVWDSIALHTNADIARYKQPEVLYTSAGTFTEIVGIEPAKLQWVRKSLPTRIIRIVVYIYVCLLTFVQGNLITVNQTEWDTILDAFPRTQFKDYFYGTLGHLCSSKPQTTYDNFLSGIGEKFVPGYNSTGHRLVDLLASLPLSDK